MKRTWLKYALLGVCAYALALAITLPARYAYSMAAPRLPKTVPVTLHDLGGSLWSGRAATVAWRNTPLGELHWDISPWSLIGGRLAMAVQLQDSDSTLSGHLTLARDGNATLRDVSARLPAGRLMAFNPGLPIAADGMIAASLEEARLSPQGVPSLRGIVVWNQALLVAGQPLKLGDLKLALQPGEQGGTVGTLSDAGGPLEINGTLTLDANRSYRLDAKLRARPEADAALGNSLKLLGRPDGRGYYTLRYNGRL